MTLQNTIKIMKKWPLLLIGISIVISIAFSYVASTRDLTTLENVFFQVFSLGIGIFGSIVLGKDSAKDAATDVIKPHARSAVRRLISLYKSLSRLAYAIDTARLSAKDHPASLAVLDKLEAIVVEQIATADDALEDWNDIVPDEIRKIRESAKE